MKKFCLIILCVLLVSVTSSFAVASNITGQQIFIPYALTTDTGWWSGLAVNNTSDSTMAFSIGAYKADGTWVPGVTFSVAAHHMEVRALPAFFSGTAPTGAMSLLIRCAIDLAPIFQATLFVGSADGGFGFQNYTSVDWVHPVVLGPPPLP
jgi:hypothetical protein